jgi:hypothetical protein
MKKNLAENNSGSARNGVDGNANVAFSPMMKIIDFDDEI